MASSEVEFTVEVVDMDRFSAILMEAIHRMQCTDVAMHNAIINSYYDQLSKCLEIHMGQPDNEPCQS